MRGQRGVEFSIAWRCHNPDRKPAIIAGRNLKVPPCSWCYASCKAAHSSLAICTPLLKFLPRDRSSFLAAFPQSENNFRDTVSTFVKYCRFLLLFVLFVFCISQLNMLQRRRMLLTSIYPSQKLLSLSRKFVKFFVNS